MAVTFSGHGSRVVWEHLYTLGQFASRFDLDSTRLNAATESRNAVAIVAIGLQIGTCLIPGNMFKLVQMDVSAAQALSYALNNALFTMGLYFGLNGFGVKVYFLKKLKRFRMKYLGFKN